MKRRAAALAQLHHATLPPWLIPKNLSSVSTRGFIRLRWGLIAESERRCDLDLKGDADMIRCYLHTAAQPAGWSDSAACWVGGGKAT